MRPEIRPQALKTSEITQGASFGISDKNSAHIMTILRDTLYSDRILAVLREYASNAWDAHQEVGKGNVPIKVRLPTQMEPTLSIRDYGPGLSPKEILEVYTQYGESTKRQSNDVVGMLGIGCLLKGQPIVTIDGMKPIEEVQVGDLVLTHNNRFKKVTEIMRRPHKGGAFRVWLSQTKTPLILTENHPILVGDRDGNTSWMRPGDVKAGYKSKKKGIRAWRSYAALPATLETTLTYLNTEEVLGPDYSFTEEGLTKRTLFRNSKNEIEHAVDSMRTTTWPKFPQLIDLDEEFGWLLGLFAAEGSTGGGKQVNLSLGLDEQELALRFSKGMEARFGVKFTWHRRQDKNILELVTYSVALAQLLDTLCGHGSANKKVPREIMHGPDAVRKGFLRGVLDGDGSSTRSKFIFGVSSPNLAWGVRTLMAITEDKWGTVGTMDDYPGRWSIHYNREAKWTYSFKSGQYLFRPIERLEYFEMETEVFNFSVDEDESYVSDFILHNSKSGFAYSDSFTVISWNGGKKRVYVAALDDTNKGIMNLLHEEECEALETGIEIKIAVKQQDIQSFHTTATELFPYFTPQPDINAELEQPWEDKDKLSCGVLHINGEVDRWLVVMGCVPYTVDLRQFAELPRYVHKVSGILFMDIGEVHINASREELKYSDETREVVENKITALIDEYTEKTLAAVENKLLSPWDKRLAISTLKVMGLPIPKQYDDLVRTSVGLLPKQKEKTFRVLLKKAYKPKWEETDTIMVSEATVLLIKDSRHSLSRYHGFGRHDYVVRAGPGVSLETLKKTLDESLKSAGIYGIPVKLLSEAKSLVSKDRIKEEDAKLAKYKGRVFTFSDAGWYGHPYSRYWSVSDQVTGKKDVFVTLFKFQVGEYSFYTRRRKDKDLAAEFRVKLPTIYGYKTSESAPTQKEDIAGIPYLEWREKFIKKLLTAPVKALIQDDLWASVMGSTAWLRKRALGSVEERLRLFRRRMGRGHPIVKYFSRLLRAMKKVAKKRTNPTWEGVRLLREEADSSLIPSEPDEAWRCIREQYPMLTLAVEDDPRELLGLSDDNLDTVLTYMQAMDER